MQQKDDKMVIAAEDCSAITNPSQENDDLQNEILNHVSHSRAIFKCQHKDEPELSFEEKKTIALNLLEKSPPQFLARFGNFLKLEHLSYFRNISNDYEISFYLKRLQRYFDREQRQVDVKNRRYEALKSLVEKGEYFSETEMMKRNPLLYDQLVGRYLTEEEKKARDNIDTQNITFVNLLMESIERDMVRNFKQGQQDAEDEIDEECDSDEEEGNKCESREANEVESDNEEEFDSDEESEGENNSVKKEKAAERTKSEEKRENFQEKNVIKNWGEISQLKDTYESEKHEKQQRDLFWYQIPGNEQQMLKQEFVSYMYQSFMDGRDLDFDYRYFTVVY